MEFDTSKIFGVQINKIADNSSKGEISQMKSSSWKLEIDAKSIQHKLEISKEKLLKEVETNISKNPPKMFKSQLN